MADVTPQANVDGSNNVIIDNQNANVDVSGVVTPPEHTPISLNLNVVVDYQGEIKMFTAPQQPVAKNVIYADFVLDVESLYSTSWDSSGNIAVDGSGNIVVEKGLIQLWEPKSKTNAINVSLMAPVDASGLLGTIDVEHDWNAFARRLRKNLQRVLVSPFDCSGAAPFNDSRYKKDAKYTHQDNFGRVVLSTYAHFLFGHVDATVAITNDKELVAEVMSVNPDTINNTETISTLAEAAYDMSTTAGLDTPSGWCSLSAEDGAAYLAERLVGALLQKGMYTSEYKVSQIDGSNNTIGQYADGETNEAANLIPLDGSGANQTNTSESVLAHIVREVTTQDPSRLMMADNSQRERAEVMPLRFYEGDTIYLNIVVPTPTVTVGGPFRPLSSSVHNEAYPSDTSTTSNIGDYTNSANASRAYDSDGKQHKGVSYSIRLLVQRPMYNDGVYDSNGSENTGYQGTSPKRTTEEEGLPTGMFNDPADSTELPSRLS